MNTMPASPIASLTTPSRTGSAVIDGPPTYPALIQQIERTPLAMAFNAEP
jgi:hypothetical protein